VAEEAGTLKKRRVSESVWGLVATHINTATTAIVIVSEMLASIGKAMAEIGRTSQNYVCEYRCHSVWHTLEAVLFPVCGLLYGLWYVIKISLRLGGDRRRRRHHRRNLLCRSGADRQ
jgi:hypothetical protein